MSACSTREPVVIEESIIRFVNGELETILPDDPTQAYLISDYPTVYICAASNAVSKHNGAHRFIAYVGETNNIRARTSQHLNGDAMVREDWRAFRARVDANPKSVRQFVVGHEHFNKSLTLDFENRMMHYLLGVSSVESLNNRRTNPQGSYYTKDELGDIFSRAWKKLHGLKPDLFPCESEVLDSALYKASPFHRLSTGQIEAERSILGAISKAIDGKTNNLPLGAYGKLIVVKGGAGTGKTVLLSHLFNTIATGGAADENGSEEHEEKRLNDVYLLISHDEQRTVYNQIALKLGLQKTEDQVVLKPITFLNAHSKKKVSKSGQSTTTDFNAPDSQVDIALIDEAHLLDTRSGQAYQGDSILLDIMRRAKVTIAVFDPEQILASSQRWTDDDLECLLGGQADSDGEFSTTTTSSGATFERLSIELAGQFRIAANDEVVTWIDNFVHGIGIAPIPKSTEYYRDGKLIEEPYEIRVFDSPVELHQAIREKAIAKEREEAGLARMLATYDWAYSSSKNPDEPQGLWNVELHRDGDGNWVPGLADGDYRGYIAGDTDPNRFCQPWNYGLSPKRGRGSSRDSWAERAATLEEVGSTYTIQGFDLNYAGVIIGPSVKYRDGKLVFDAAASKNKGATNKRRGVIDYSEANLRNELNVLLKRGVHGLYLFAVDQELQAALMTAAKAGSLFCDQAE